MAFYIYVVNEPGHLVGVVSLRALVTHSPNTTLENLMVSDVISVATNTDQEEVARLAARYNLLAIPVVDEGNCLVGIVTIDDVIDVIREEATEDILKMAGADETAYENNSIMRNFRTRAPWLFATWLGGLSASVLISTFEHHLQATVALAAFIPIVLGMGGNVGIQTATIIVRGLATGHVSRGRRYAISAQRDIDRCVSGHTLWGVNRCIYRSRLRRFGNSDGIGADRWYQCLGEYGIVRGSGGFHTTTVSSDAN